MRDSQNILVKNIMSKLSILEKRECIFIILNFRENKK